MDINKKLNENLLNMNFNYENLKSIKNLIELSFLKKDIDQILNNNDINQKFKKIMSIYGMMENTNIINKIDETQIEKNSEKTNEITIKIKIEQNDVGKTIYLLDNTYRNYYENDLIIPHNHDNLNEMNENNTIMTINGNIVPFKKSFIPAKTGIYLIKLLLKNKLSNCAYMFSECNNIIDIDFSKFNIQNICFIIAPL